MVPVRTIAMPTKSQNNLVRRPPVVVVMGHIDHGKSTLLDYIRKSNVVAGEAGGITQHVGAYQAEHITADGTKHPITFLDTPGHAAFCSIRERGARSADIAILVVSAEDGVKPQTLEAYEAIKENGVPFVVAINKIDKPNADIDRAKQSLGEHEIYVEGWGGDVPCVPISAIAGTGISELLDMILLMADLENLSADPAAPASGIVIESELDTRKGISATVLVQNGTLTVGSYIVAGGSYSPIRFIENFQGAKIDSAGPSTPARIIGWNVIPVCGLEFFTYEKKKEAEAAAREHELKIRSQRLAAKPVPIQVKPASSADSPVTPSAAADEEPMVVTIPLIIKADVIGSLEGIEHELEAISHDKVRLKIVSTGIGEFNENDIKLAMSDPNIVMVGFGVGPDKKAQAVLERTPVTMKTFLVIYELVEYVKNLLLSKIPKEYIEEVTGRAKILATFSKEKDRQVLGGKVETGTLESGNEVRIIRRDAEIGRGKIRELQQQKKRASEIREGFEFGALIEAKTEVAIGDRIEAVRTVEKKA